MTDFFAVIYEFFFYNANYVEIFNVLFLSNGYALLGLTFIIFPIIGLSVFYYFINNPYFTLMHWIINALIIGLVVYITSWLITQNIIYNENYGTLNECLNSIGSGYATFADLLSIEIAILNSIFALIITFLYSIVLKRFSKTHMHLPL